MVIEILRQEHRDIEKLLHVLERELGVFARGRAKASLATGAGGRGGKIGTLLMQRSNGDQRGCDSTIGVAAFALVLSRGNRPAGVAGQHYISDDGGCDDDNPA